MKIFILSIVFLFLLYSIPPEGHTQSEYFQKEILPAAYSITEYLPQILGKRVAIVGNNTSMIGKKHLVDTLLSLHVNIVKIFGPEHGFRGNAADGTTIANVTDANTGIPVISLYGNHKKPTDDELRDVDMMVFDIQDVGTRFYTYISTLTYVMQACAEKNIPLIVLDRPNPNGYYIDGPVLKPEYSSFVGLHPVPIVYGMTIGEYALMVNGERWLENGLKCNLKVIPCAGYTHDSRYQLPIKPSPNLPDMKSVYLYPSLCLFEGTVVSVGRGTDFPFQVIGHPSYQLGTFSFTPRIIIGVSENPPYKGQKCKGLNLAGNAGLIREKGHIDLLWFTKMYHSLNLNDKFFNSFFDKLAGTDQLRKQVMMGLNEDQIRNSWQEDLKKFKRVRSRYLLYPDFQ